jgi:cyclophilin family peptidyl-prolyl cis-trans isomerase
MNNNRLFFIEMDDPEVDNVFKKHFPDSMYNEVYGEVIQYMGTVQNKLTGEVWHEFRHRAVPGTNERKYWKINPSSEFIQRVRKGEFK